PLYIFVCPDCLDTPQEQLRALVLPADPVPIYLPFPEPFSSDETTAMTLTQATTDPVTGLPVPGTTQMTTSSGVAMTPEPYGRPPGLIPDAIMPLALTDGVPNVYGAPLSVLSVVANGADQVAVTCASPHGLATQDQVGVEGLNNASACGIFSVDVTTATAFTYQVYPLSIPAGSLLGATTRIVTAQVAAPTDYPVLQQVGP